MKKPIIRNIIIIASVLIVGIIVYKVFLSGPSAPTSTLSTTAGVGSTASGTTTAGTSAGTSVDTTVGQDFLALLLSVQSIKLDDSIFQSQAFNVLQDFNRPIPPDTDPGRTDPFAPIGADGSSVSYAVSTSNPSSITPTTSTLNGALSSADAGTTRWFEYGLTQNLGTMTPPKSQTTPGAFAESIAGLTPNTTYYVRASALLGGATVSGNIVTWKTAQGGTQKQ